MLSTAITFEDCHARNKIQSAIRLKSCTGIGPNQRCTGGLWSAGFSFQGSETVKTGGGSPAQKCLKKVCLIPKSTRVVPKTFFDQANKVSAFFTRGSIWQAERTAHVRKMSTFFLDRKASCESLKSRGTWGSFSW